MDRALCIAALAALAWAVAERGTDAIRRWAARRNLLDMPNARSSHTRPTPRGGGLAVALAVLAGTWAYAAFWSVPSLGALGLFTCGAGLVAAISAWDDVRRLPAWARFSAHGAAAALALWAFGFWPALGWPGLGWIPLGAAGMALAFLWVVGLTNAYNFMDGIDGLAGVQAVIAGLGWAGLGWIGGLPLAGVMGLLMAAASLGFLRHNWPPAKIFMGDVGSAFLGYVLSVLTLAAAQADPAYVLAGVALVWPFVFDAAFTFVRRAVRGERVWKAHRSHLYQRLVITGLSHRRVSVVYGVLAALGGGLAFAAILGRSGWSLAGASAIGLAAAGLWVWTCRRERRMRRMDGSSGVAECGRVG